MSSWRWSPAGSSALRLRRRYLLAFLGTWVILGSVLAIPLASGGPIFFAMFEPAQAERFAEIDAYLRVAADQMLVTSVSAQDWLRESAATKAIEFGTGISAMPSVHVGIAFLQVLLALQIGHRLAIVAAAYFVAILVGSVHLGWHYAIDGYVGILLAWASWALAGRWTRFRSDT